MPISRIDIAPLLPAISRHATLLVPNHRIGDAIITSFANTTDAQTLLTPRVFAIDIWLRDLWELGALNGQLPFAAWQLLSPGEEHFIWTAIVEASLAEQPLLNPEETARAVNQSYRDLKQWLPNNPLGRLEQAANNPDAFAFLQWIKAYKSHCEQQQLVSLVDAIEKLLSSPESLLPSLPTLPSEIVLVNFFEPPPLYDALFAHLAKVTRLEHVQVLQDVPPQACYRHSFNDQSSELIACAQWARSLCRAEPDSHIGIICSEDLLAQPTSRHLLETALGGDSRPALHTPAHLYNSSGSRQPLLDTGLVTTAFQLFDLAKPAHATIELSRLLQSPYLTGATSEREARLQMERQMRRYFTATTALSDFSWHLQREERPTYSPLLATALLAARTRYRQFPATASAREWATHLHDWLLLFGWPGDDLTATDARTLAQWQDLLRAFAHAGTALGRITFGTAVARLRSQCSQQPLSSLFRAETPVSVYTVTEALGLHFDHAWLLGFSAQAWPPSARPSPFIPYALQQEAGIPGSHSDLQFARAGRALQVLCGSVSHHLIASYHTTDGELAFSPSSAINAWPEREPTIAPVTAASLLLPVAAESIALVAITDPSAFPLRAGEAVRGGQSIISNQSSCPFRAFALHRLQAEPLSPYAAGLSMRDRGSALHAALEWLFTRIDSAATLAALTEAERSTLVAQAATHAVEYLSQRHRELMTPRFRALEQQRMTTLLENFLSLESERQGFRVLAREESLQWQHGELELNLKIDRIDELDDHSLALIDYKTGKRVSSSQNWIEARPEDMQLPLYYTVAAAQKQQPVTALVIAHINVEKLAYSGIAAAENVHTAIKPASTDRRIQMEWQELTANWQAAVQQRAQEFVEGQAQVAPIHGRRTCNYCGLESLCRIQELDASMLDDEPDVEAEA